MAISSADRVNIMEPTADSTRKAVDKAHLMHDGLLTSRCDRLAMFFIE